MYTTDQSWKVAEEKDSVVNAKESFNSCNYETGTVQLDSETAQLPESVTADLVNSAPNKSRGMEMLLIHMLTEHMPITSRQSRGLWQYKRFVKELSCLPTPQMSKQRRLQKLQAEESFKRHIKQHSDQYLQFVAKVLSRTWYPRPHPRPPLCPIDSVYKTLFGTILSVVYLAMCEVLITTPTQAPQIAS